ncbi:hypothetical protein NIE79_006195 [Micromonospora sp. NIE79]|uniref:Uncharacterized protein n=1 Tax=Micromonospora trifolii TaxID=2911208 RepID=A0ABS9NBS9_9ACTN|nr:hypothetical protein [Micromonospora trifolii]MCG5447423.1 hypothetical protein [Micromonospora trifolii]
MRYPSGRVGPAVTAASGTSVRAVFAHALDPATAERLRAYAEKALASRWGRPGCAGED